MYIKTPLEMVPYMKDIKPTSSIDFKPSLLNKGYNFDQVRGGENIGTIVAPSKGQSKLVANQEALRKLNKTTMVSQRTSFMLQNMDQLPIDHLNLLENRSKRKIRCFQDFKQQMGGKRRSPLRKTKFEKE